MTDKTIANLLREDRTFPPSDEFRRNALVSDESVYEEGADLEAFWAKRAEEFEWFRR
jgi:acetyl-CoA synthetase